MVLIYNVICSIGLILSIYARYDLYMRWHISRGLLTEHDNLRTSGWVKKFFLEIAINIICPYPLLDKYKYYEYNKTWNVTLEYDLNDILLVWSFIRIYLLIRFVLVMTKFMNPRS